MLPSSSTSQPVVFDGTNQSLSFMEFVNQLTGSPEWNNLAALSPSKDIEDIVPGHLYGEALRFYESLDTDCQQDWSQFREVMANRFPGAVRSGGVILRSEVRYVDGLTTSAEPPPVTLSKLAVPSIEVNGSDGPDSREDVIKHKRPRISFSFLKDKLHILPHARNLPPTNASTEPRVAVYSMYIEYAHGGTPWRPLFTSNRVVVKLDDPLVVAEAAKTPLITIPSNDDSERYRVGFTYAVIHGEWSIDMCHKVLAPRKSKIDYLQCLGERTVTPTCQLSQAYSISGFIYDHTRPYHRKTPPPGRYTIKSLLRSRNTQTFAPGEVEEAGEITWILDVV